MYNLEFVKKKMFLFACISLFLISKSSGCPDEPGWIPVGDFGCYLMSQVKFNWFAAHEFCWSHGGYLAEIYSQEEHNILDQFLVHDVAHWIGLTDLSEEGTDIFNYQDPSK